MYQISLRPRDTYSHWRALAEYWRVSAGAKQKLEWIIFYHTVGRKNASVTAAYFGISRKTLHKWLKRFNPSLIQSLEEQSRAPHQTRSWEVAPEQEERIIALRNGHLKYGKQKLKLLYQKQYQEKVSTWKIERVIRKHRLYPDPQEQQRQLKRRRKRQAQPKIRINKLKIGLTQAWPGTVWHTDSIILWWYGQKRVIFTALEEKTKLGFARVYPNHSSRTAKDFLERLVYLSDGDLRIIHSDNGSEFAGEFTKACQQLGIWQVYNRPRTPKDNPALERFNWTVQDEWLSLSEVGLDEIPAANLDLTAWLLEYNNQRPHAALDYQTPIEYANEHYFKVLPMWPARTIPLPYLVQYQKKARWIRDGRQDSSTKD
jgi:transposase InsO family protein